VAAGWGPAAEAQCVRPLVTSLKPLLIRILRPAARATWVLVVGPFLTFVNASVGRAMLKGLHKAPTALGIPVIANSRDEHWVLPRLEEVFRYIARCPRHWAHVRSAISCVGVGGGFLTRHGQLISGGGLHGCDLGITELQTQSIPALAATVVYAAAQIRLNRAGLLIDAHPPERRRRALLLCDKAQKDFLDYAQRDPRAA
jgi:hypothetical protein